MLKRRNFQLLSSRVRDAQLYLDPAVRLDMAGSPISKFVFNIMFKFRNVLEVV